MSIEIVKSQIQRFLASDQPEVMAIKGKWGVGKTYSWNKFLLEAKNEKIIKYQKYSYVSLFGINSLDAFKYSIFANGISIDLFESGTDASTFQTNLDSLLRTGKKSLPLVENITRIFSKTNLVTIIEAAAFFSIKQYLICIDDLERVGKGLEIKDVLGLVSLLKEQKKCKIVLLLNDGEEGLNDYKKYREKVIDFELAFDPTAEECAKIAFAETNLNECAANVLNKRLTKNNKVYKI